MTPAPSQRMFYFGPWDNPGHHFHNEGGGTVWEEDVSGFPFGHISGRVPVDGRLQPGCSAPGNRLERNRDGYDEEGLALIHHVNGWTALCFWDRSVGKRRGCNSNYFAEGTFTFEEMVAMAKARFAHRWNKMKFDVRLAESRP